MQPFLLVLRHIVPAPYNSVTSYAPIALALILVLGYFIAAVLLIRLPDPPRVIVARYEPPAGVSPAVTAWLFEPGDLPRAIAAAIVNMAAKGFLRIEQNGDLYSIIRLETEPSMPQEPEEHVLARKLLDDTECFDFVEVTPQLQDAVQAFRWALHNTTYFSQHIAVSIPAWIVSAAAIALATVTTHHYRGPGQMLGYEFVLLFGCFTIAVRTIRGPINKIASRMPWSTAPRRPWSGADTMPLTFLAATVVGVALLALMTTPVAALFVAAFMVVNAVFLHALQGPTAAGRKMAAPLAEYKKFLSEVEADAISRMDSAERLPGNFTQKGAYALAFHLDLGWGEQFVSSIADLVEYADVFKYRISRD